MHSFILQSETKSNRSFYYGQHSSLQGDVSPLIKASDDSAGTRSRLANIQAVQTESSSVLEFSKKQQASEAKLKASVESTTESPLFTGIPKNMSVQSTAQNFKTFTSNTLEGE